MADIVERLDGFCEAILHGDDEHRQWLRDTFAAFKADNPIPQPRGSGRKEAEIDRLRKQVAMLREAADYAFRGFNVLADEIEAHRPGWIPDREIRLTVKEGACVKSIADVSQALSATADLDGYVLVPREPTEAMVMTAHEIRRQHEAAGASTHPTDIYRAMLDAHRETGNG